MSAFGGARGSGSKPPEKGIFPLDHFGECKQLADQYLKCLKVHGTDAAACRELSKQYLECRMQRNLMAKQELSELGFHTDKQQPGSEAEASSRASTG